MFSIDTPAFVPAGGKQRIAIHIKLPMIDSPPKDASANEHKAYVEKIKKYLNEVATNLGGFDVFDDANRAHSEFQKGW